MTFYDLKFQLLIALEAFVFLGGGGLLLFVWWLLRPAEEEGRARRRLLPFVRKVKIPGPCPFLTCLETRPHTHPICPACGAVRYGNAFCATCRSEWPAESAKLKRYLEEHGL